MSDIFKQHDAAFAHVSAFVIMKGGERVATIAFKFPRDGAGRLYAYVHWIGLEMVRGYAGGYGYDKRSAAVANAVAKIRSADGGWKAPVNSADQIADVLAFLNALATDSGRYWDDRLRDAGFTVLQAV